MNLYGISLDPTEEQVQALKAKAPGDVILGVRPEHFRVVPAGTPNSIKAQLVISEMMGSEMYLHVDIEGKTAVVRASTLEMMDIVIDHSKKEIYLTIPCNCTHLFDAATEARI